eukprot:6309634-Prymnesium_polylepis.1
MRAFEISFTAALPYNMAMVLENALEHDPPLLEPVEAHSPSSRRLHAQQPPGAPSRDGGGVRQDAKMGPRNIVWLRKKLDPKH